MALLLCSNHLLEVDLQLADKTLRLRSNYVVHHIAVARGKRIAEPISFPNHQASIVNMAVQFVQGIDTAKDDCSTNLQAQSVVACEFQMVHNCWGEVR